MGWGRNRRQHLLYIPNKKDIINNAMCSAPIENVVASSDMIIEPSRPYMPQTRGMIIDILIVFAEVFQIQIAVT